MKIVVISDIHDNHVNLKKCLSWCRKNKIEEMICCGDVAGDETIEMLSVGFRHPIHLVKGNMDYFHEFGLKNFENIFYYNKIGRVQIDNLQIGFCHEPYLLAKVLEKGKCDIVFYGHTHKPWEEEKSGARFVNPGTLAGMFQRGTFAVFDTRSGEMELKLLEMI
jgi:putative phosphoesterase